MRPRLRPPALALLVLSLSLLALAGCGTQSRMPTSPAASGGPTASQLTVSRDLLSDCIRVQESYGGALLDLYGVVGTGVADGGDGAPCIKVFVTRSGLRLPTTLQGIRVEQEEAGPFTPFALTARMRPLAIGISVGNANECIPGTIGCVLQQGNRRFLLSCNHVFARQNLASLGETIVQPSRTDESADCSPSPAQDAVAVLSDFQPLDFAGGPNTFDAAIAEVTVMPSQLTCATPPGFYGAPGATPVPAARDMPIMKVGRTTELTRGNVKATNVKIKITYPTGVALFTGVVLTSAGFGAFGDSGSLVVTDDGARAPVGLLFSGDAQGRGVVCPIAPILSRFGATICTN